MDLNLDTLKYSITDALDQSEFAVFRHDPGVFDPSRVITWDVETYPDYNMFLEAARKLGTRLILFSARVFSPSEIQEASEELELAELERDERREFMGGLDKFRKRLGSICSIELAFPHLDTFYLYEARADWYEEFVNLTEEISSMLGIDDEEEDELGSDDTLGGFYSKN